MDLKEACDRTGLSERTLRRFIKDGKLTAIMVDHHWEIIPESLEGLVRKNSGQENGHMPENDRTASGQAECPNCEWMRQHLEDQLMEKDRQLSEKDKQSSNSISYFRIARSKSRECCRHPGKVGGGGPGNSQQLISLK